MTFCLIKSAVGTPNGLKLAAKYKSTNNDSLPSFS
jgi:hypothetical protein